MTVRTGEQVGLDQSPPPRPGPFVKPRPQVGLALLVLAAAFPVRFELGGGYTASLFDVAVALCLLQLVFMLGVLRRWTLPPRALMLAATVPTLAALLSLAWADDFGAATLMVLSGIESVVVLVFVTTVLRDQYPVVAMRWLVRFGLALLIAPALMYLGVSGFEPPDTLDPLSGDYLSFYTRFSHPFIGRSNNIATLLAVVFIPLAYWASRYRAHRLALILIGGALVLTLSRGVLLATTVAAALLVVRSRKQAGRIFRRLAAPLILGALAVVAAIFYDPTVAANIGSRLDVTNVTARGDLLTTGWAAVSENVLLGAGAGAGEDVHNTYLQQLVYFGLLLGVVVAWFIARAASGFFGLDDLTRAVGLGIVAALLSFLVESSLEGSLLRPLIFLAFGLGAAVAASGQRLLRDRDPADV